MKIFILGLVCTATYASDLCLMLSPEEDAALTHAQNQARKGKPSNDRQSLRLDGIIYTHQASWTIWLNGRSITAGETIDTFRILKVTPESVEMIWNPQPNQRHQVYLKPNEVFQTKNAPP